MSLGMMRKQVKKLEQEVETKDRKHTLRKNTVLDWSRNMDRPSVHSTASSVLAGSRFQNRTRSTKDKLQRPSSERRTNTGAHHERGQVWPNVSTSIRAKSRTRIQPSCQNIQ